MDLLKIALRLEDEIKQAELEAQKSGRHFYPRSIELKVCGQNSLLADEFLLKKILKEFGYFFDELSEEIWMPEDTIWEVVHIGENVRLYKARAIDVLVSKAIKAKVKNRVLIKNALLVYGDELKDRIIKFGGEPNDEF